jgi:BMFP domain-containing protein YqiC
MNPLSAVQKIIDSISESVGQSDFGPELKLRMKQALQSALADMDLVTREEFDAQSKVLQHTRARLEQLEKELTELSLSANNPQTKDA